MSKIITEEAQSGRVVKNTNIFRLFILNLSICTLAMGAFVFRFHFSVDDYWVYDAQKRVGMSVIDQSMRIVLGGIYFFLDDIGINIISQQIFFGMLLILAYAWVCARISSEIAEVMGISEEPEKILMINAGTLILFLNASVSEYLYYANAYIQCILGSLGITYGAICIGRIERKPANRLAGMAALIVAASSYQTFLAQYAYIVMVIIFARNGGKINKRSVTSVIEAMAAAVAALGINIACVKALVSFGVIAENSRMHFSLGRLPELFLDIIHYQRSIWIDGMGIYPKGLLAAILILTLGLLCVVLYRKKAGVDGIAFSMAALLSGLCVVYAVQIMQGFIRVTNRGMYAVFGVYTVAIWVICYYLRTMDRKHIWKAGIFGAGVFLLYSIVKTNGIATDVMITNAVSRCYIEEIERRICIYEDQADIRVTKIGFCSDASVSYRFYSFIETGAYGDMCASPFLADWSNVTSFKYYSGRELELTKVPEHVADYYAGQDWTEADWDKQLFFDHDTVYVCMY